ncbi:MFS transporter [Nocardiopsis composta]|uniref:MFS family permease n=1 Tax=Nocardiopsis composta TaxID=157465 RepID=A0A7W8VBD8_9ACTN|nr:MFS transporter [Nocardiopsis composta]MBB5430241.1 MFS family permease [Nocardiopsis composta]
MSTIDENSEQTGAAPPSGAEQDGGEGSAGPAGSPRKRSPLPLVYLVVLGGFLGQQIMMPIIAPLSRELGMAEWEIGLITSLAAVIVTLMSGFWGRRSQIHGRKPIMVLALATAAVATLGFALTAHAGLAGALGGGVLLFVLLALTRSVLFGTALAAIPPSAQAYVADVTEGERDRVRGMAGIGAAQGIAMVLGAALGGLLAGAGLLVPLYLIPVLLAVLAAVVIIALPAERRHADRPTPPRVSPLDGRFWPFLAVGFAAFSALGFVQITVGFLVQDRLSLSAEATGASTGIALFAAGIGMFAAQGLIVPRLGWPPARLIRVGLLVSVAGFLILLPDLGLASIIASMALLGLGLGTAVPGYNAGPTLLAADDEQGGIAGMLSANTALTFVVAPTASTFLYGVQPLLPIGVSLALLAAGLAVSVLHPRLRAAAAQNPGGQGSGER